MEVDSQAFMLYWGSMRQKHAIAHNQFMPGLGTELSGDSMFTCYQAIFLLLLTKVQWMDKCYCDKYAKRHASFDCHSYGTRREKTSLLGLRTTKMQTDHRLSYCIISKLATGEISTFQLVSVAEKTDFRLTLSDTLKPGLSEYNLCKGRIYMGQLIRGSRKFFQRGSNFDYVIF